VTPGISASSSCTTGIAPTAGTITLTPSAGPTALAEVYVLSYGAWYQQLGTDLGSQFFNDKFYGDQDGVRCSRTLTM